MMHRAVRSIIPQEVAMFDFLKQKDRTPPVLPEGTVRRHFSISGQVQGWASATGRATRPRRWS